jgi:hypothetical protein
MLGQAGSLTICAARVFGVPCSVGTAKTRSARKVRTLVEASQTDLRLRQVPRLRVGLRLQALCSMHLLFAWCAHRAVRTVGGTPGVGFRCAHQVVRTKCQCRVRSAECRIEEAVSYHSQPSAARRSTATARGARRTGIVFRHPTSDGSMSRPSCRRRHVGRGGSEMR